MKGILFSCFLLMFCTGLYAKRGPAPVVKEVFWRNMKISSYFLYISESDKWEIGIVLKDSLKIKYKIPVLIYEYDKHLEEDVQDIYITEINVFRDAVKIKTEGGGVFLVYPNSKKVFCVKIPQGTMLDVAHNQFVMKPVVK